ncbi:MAG: 3-oxoacyl-[acyl-carrier-protein] reductase [Acetanaerobacterium sp.]
MSKTAIVTGANRGIGAATAIVLADKGCDIALVCRSQASADNEGEQVAAKCRESGVQAHCFVCDVSDFSACADTVSAVKTRFGSIDVLVNNAGITRDGLLARMKEEQFDEVIATNLKGAFNMLRHVSAVMIRQKSGRIINVSSVAGLYGNAGQVNYSASKAGLLGITMSAAKELAPRGITVNAVAPGFIETDMTAALPDSVKEKVLPLIPMGRYGKAQEVAAVIAFLASDEASYVTGQVLAIDGALMM